MGDKVRMPKCTKCGYSGPRSEFSYYAQAYETGTTSLRKCPKCENLVFCDEAEEDRLNEGKNPWGISRFRGRIFPGKKKEENVNEM